MEKPAFPLSMSEHDVLATQRLTSSRPPARNALPLPGLSPQQVLPQFHLQVLPQFRLQVLPQFRLQFLPQPHRGFFLSSASSFFRSPTAGSSSVPPPVSQPLALGRADVRFVVRPPCSAAYEAGPLLAAGLGVPGFWLVSCVSRMISRVAR